MADDLMQWFLAAMLHDLGKTLISSRGWWDSHANLGKAQSGKVSFVNLLTPEMIARISTHETRDDDGNRRKFPRDTPEESALVMADQLQKAMYEAEKDGDILENHVAGVFPKARFNPPFLPYYGQPIVWTQAYAEQWARQIVETMRGWNQQPTLADVLALEKFLVHSPHTTVIPHNSLAFHQRFTAIFFYLIYRQLARLPSVYDWRQLDFAIATIKPDPLNLFYRLKDVKAHEVAVRERLRRGVFERVFKSYVNDLPQMSVEANPFEFFGRDALVVVVENVDTLIQALQEILDADETESLKHVTAQVVRFTIHAPDTWVSQCQWRAVPPKNVQRTPSDGDETYHLLSKRASRFATSVTPRCERCGQPLGPDESLTGNICKPCATLLKQTDGVGGEMDKLFPEAERRGFVFLNLPDDLLDEAKHQAAVLLEQLKQDTARFKPKEGVSPERQAEVLACIKPTPTGIFEYLQAVMEIEVFQRDVLEKAANVFPLIQFPTLMIWVTTESDYWDFVLAVSEKLEQLHLSASPAGLLCHPRTPFWSLMDRLTKFSQPKGVSQHGEFYDLSGGEVMVFSNDEVKAIRDLARSAFSDQAFKTQLNALVQFARVASLQELEMEIDARDNARKIRHDFCTKLKDALNRMPGDDQTARDKRALFIKNIVRLAGFQAERISQDKAQGRR